jgi:subtilase family serine protease
MNELRRVVRPLATTALLFCPLLALTQAPQPRLSGPIAQASRITLPGSHSPRVNGSDLEDLGPVAPNMSVPGITLVFKRSPAQESGLQALLAAQQNPSSPLYRHWLTPDDFAARFGMADADISTVETWLTSRGFQLDAVSRTRDRITFSGTAAQVQDAFGAELHRYRSPSALHFAAASDLSLPAGLASVTAAVLHLSDFRPKPLAHTIAHPDFTSASAQAHFLGPQDIATMYDLNPLYQSGFDGSGQSLAVVGQSYVDTTPVNTFQADLTQTNNITQVLVPGSGVEAISPGDEGESQIDLEYSSGVAQKASIFLVYVGANQNYDVIDSLTYAITNDLAPVISISYTICEPVLSSTDLSQANSLFEEAAAQGQTIVAAAGDSGSTGCADYPTSAGITTAQQQSLAVGFPADSPYITAVGGTQMAPGTFASGASQYWAPATTSDNLNSLLSYVPEVVWNEDSASFGIAASGGGASTYFPRPSWQAGVPGIPSGAFRLIPDISLQASIQDPGYLICTSDPELIGQTASCSDGLKGSTGQYTIVGGTSFAAPIFAGFVAILNQYEQTLGQGSVNPTLYTLAANPSTYAAAFHDITSGTNACKAGDGDCAISGESSFAATTGYDEATGLGSLDFGKLASAWPASAGGTLTTTVTKVLPLQATASAGQSIPVEFSVCSISCAAGSTSPTGFLSILLDGQVVEPSFAYNANTIQSYSIVAPAAVGSHLITAVYSGDANYAPSVGSSAVTVGNVTATGSFALLTSPLSIASGGYGVVPVTITPQNGYAGRITWSVGVTGSAGAPSIEYCWEINSPAVNGSTNAQLTVGNGAACSSPLPNGDAKPQIQTSTRSSLAITTGAAMLLCTLLRRRRRSHIPTLALFAVLSILGLSLTGCGGGSNNTGCTDDCNTGPTSADYTVTLTGTDSVNQSISSSSSFTLTVK